jgi:hypothetical protein
MREAEVLNEFEADTAKTRWREASFMTLGVPPDGSTMVGSCGSGRAAAVIRSVLLELIIIHRANSAPARPWYRSASRIILVGAGLLSVNRC